ncbi:MAG: hypothetical protein QXM96_01585, partial [Candidatus Woesearchaeota archaeon]
MIDSFEEYLNNPAISATDLKNFSKSPNVFYYKKYIEEKTQTESLLLGTALHCAILETNVFLDKYFLLPEIDKRTKIGKDLYNEILEKNKGKIPLNKEQ